MPVEMDCKGRSTTEFGKDTKFKKSPMSIPKSYSVKCAINDHESYRSSGSAIEDLFSRKKVKVPPGIKPGLKGKDVLNRLDSLLAGDSQDVSSEHKGILKQKPNQGNTRSKKKHIRFPDPKKLHKIIGWDGGEEYYGASSTSGDSSDEEEKRPAISKSFRNEELTIEERNVINLTRKNTSYNSHAPNLLKDNPTSGLELLPNTFALGSKTKSPPLVLVRPFTTNSSPGKVNKVQPMINGEIVNSYEKQATKFIEDSKLNTDIDQVQNELRNDPITDKLNSDGGSCESSSPPLSEGESTGFSSPEQDIIRPPKLSSSTAIRIDVSSSHQSKTSIDITGNDESKNDSNITKSSPINRLSFLNSTLSTYTSEGAAPLDTLNKSDKESAITICASSNVSKGHYPTNLLDPLKTTASSDEYTSVYVTSANSLKGSKEAESLVDGTRRNTSQLNRSKTSSVKLTRSSPYTLGTSSSTSILKGTPKPSVVIRKPPVSKDKPKLPLKPSKIVSAKFASASMYKNPCQTGTFHNSTLEIKNSAVNDNSNKCENITSNTEQMLNHSYKSTGKILDSSEVAINEGPNVEIITVNGKPTSTMAECYSADCDVQNSLIFDVKASNCDNANEKEIHDCQGETVTITSNSPYKDDKTSNDFINAGKSIKCYSNETTAETNAQVLSKNREELLKAIRESLSDKLLTSSVSLENGKGNTLNNEIICNEENTIINTTKVPLTYTENKKKADIQESKIIKGKSFNASSTSSNFQATRAQIANALGGQIISDKNLMRQSFAKRQAPKPPSKEDKGDTVNSVAVDGHENPMSSPNENTKVLSDQNEMQIESKYDEHNDSVELNTEESSCFLTAPTKDLPPEPLINKNVFRDRTYNPKKPLSPPPPISFKQSHPPPPKSVLVAAARHSSMKSEMSPSRNAIKKGVQFNPETTMLKIPDSMDLHVTNHDNMIKCNRWLKDGSSPTNSVPKVVESSFTGQPIQVSNSHPATTTHTTTTSSERPSHQSSSQLSHLQQRSPHHIKTDQNTHLLSPVVSYAQNAPSKDDDEHRKWTEKKKKRSKSLPRGSEIDEIVGSSKTKSTNSRFFQTSGIQAAQHLMTTVTGISNSPSSTSIRRHSRVELYENDRKQQRKQAAKFSLKKFFKLGMVDNPYQMQLPSSHSTDTSPYHGNKSDNQVQFLDKEHEREIVERERSKAKCRPEIIHPLDLQQKMMSNVPLVAGAFKSFNSEEDHLNGGSRLNNGIPTVFPAVELVKITPKSMISPSNNNKVASASNKLATVNSTANNKTYNGHFEKNIYNGNNGRTAGVNKAGVNKSIMSKSKLEAYIATNTSTVTESTKNDSGHETSSIHTDNSDGSSSSYNMFSSSSGGSDGSGEDTNTNFLKDNLQNQSQEKTKKENTYNSYYNGNFNHSRSSSSSNDTANALSIASSSTSTSFQQSLHQKHQQVSYPSENSSTTISPPSSNSETEGYSTPHQSSSKDSKPAPAQNGVVQPSNTEKTNNFVQQPIASTLLSSSVSSTIEAVDGKSVVSRSRLNSSGRPKPIPPPRSQSLEGNNLQNDSKQNKPNANQVAEISRKISLPACNIILEQPSQPSHLHTTPPSSPSYQVYANIDEITTVKEDNSSYNCDTNGSQNNAKPNVIQDRNHGNSANNEPRKTLTSPYAVSNAMVIDKREEKRGNHTSAKNNSANLNKLMNKNNNISSLPPSGYILPGKMKLGNSLNVAGLNSVNLGSIPQNISESNTSESASQSQRSEVSSSAANFLLSMMAVSSEGSGISNSSNNNSSKMSNLSGTFMGDYQNGSEGANSSERESISPYRSTIEESIEEDGSSNLVANEPHAPIRNKKLPYKKDLSIIENTRGRSVVHKNLEDNYGAVISANHEALAQLLEQTSQNQPNLGHILSKSMPGDKKHLKLSDFSILENAGSVKTVAGNFYSATYDCDTNNDKEGDGEMGTRLFLSKSNKLPVTLLISSKDQSMGHSKNQFSLSAALSFQDNASYINNNGTIMSDSNARPNEEVYVNVYNRLQIETLEIFTARVSNNIKKNSQCWEKEVSFILLQFINALKYLQAQGTEEISSNSLNYFLLVRDDKDPHYRIVMLEDNIKRQDNEVLSLCSIGLAALLLLFGCENPIQTVKSGERIDLPELTPSVGMFSTMCELLQRSSSMALGQVKSMLEYMLWGPNDIAFEFIEEHKREEELQRWLDLERATVLNNLIRTKGWLSNIELAVFEEYHLLFLVQTCAKMLHEASMLFESEVSCM